MDKNKSLEDRARIIADEVRALIYENAKLQKMVSNLREQLNSPQDEKLSEALEKIKALEAQLASSGNNPLTPPRELRRRHAVGCRGKDTYYKVLMNGSQYYCCDECGFYEKIR